MQIKNSQNNKGAVTLIAVLIIGFIISAIIINASVYNRLSVLNYSKIKGILQTKYSSESCIELALLEIYNDRNFTGSGNISDGDIDCSYVVSNLGGQDRVITSTSEINGLNYYNEVNISITSSIEVNSWKRVTGI